MHFTAVFLLFIATTFAAPSAPNDQPYHIQSFAEIVGILEPLQASDCQPGTFRCDTRTAESYHVVTWVLTLIGMGLLAILFLSYCVAVGQILWHRNG
jgi:hypothetical protein